MERPPRRVAVIRLSALGDVTQALPAVLALREAWPESRIDWILGPAEAALLAGLPDITLRRYDKASGLRGMWALRRGGPRYDLLLLLQTSARANLLARLTPALRRVGMGVPLAREGHALAVHELAPMPPRPHFVEAYLAVARHLGVPVARPRWRLPIPAAAVRWAQAQLPEGPFLAVNPSASPSRRVHREWPLERFVPVLAAAHEMGLPVVLVGGPGARERRRAAELAAACPFALRDLTGRTDLKQLLAVLARARLLLSVDSGPVHLACALGTPVLALYAATDPAQTGPYGDAATVVSAYPEAIEAEYGKPPEALPWGTRCHLPEAMARISVAQVLEALEAALRVPFTGSDR